MPGVERMLGNFINTLPMRVSLVGKDVDALLREVDETLARLVELEFAPLSVAQRCTDLDGDAPLFTAVFNFRHFEPGPNG
ncbi:Peptide synthetase [Enhygromyxa salina]|uniref:Peptide synthetase n=1 Tax=Enhygromyxa salina TaxID=215803 RepID=A0A0C2CPX4_9BACT|nr:Peptide synthetase [Enhygromyxa salina]